MLKNIRNKILQIRQACGIEIVLLPDGEMHIRAVILRLDRNRIVKEKEFGLIRSFEELSKKVPHKYPVALVVNGKGVLHKKITTIGPLNTIFESVLPNANPADFYVELSRYNDLMSAFIVRTDVLDKIVQQLLQENYKVLFAAPGAGSIFYLAPYMNTEKKVKIRSNTYTFRLSENKDIEEIVSLAAETEDSWEQPEYNVGDQYVSASGVIAFGAALGLIAGNVQQDQHLKSERIRAERREFRFFKYFVALSWGLLTGLLAILLVNFILFNYYFDKNVAAQSSRIMYDEQRDQAGRLEQNVRAKESFIRQFGWDRAQRLSYYADRIGGLVPENTLLTTMKIFPVNEALFGENPTISFKQDTILVSGSCEDPTELNRFSNNLKNISDFREVTIKNYLYKKESQSGAFLMQIITI